ncbi:MAG: glycoside hydrolase [Planctomycetes bacterium]|nr:glycoside hydrolase [Planctomycetota bacterium]
MSSCACGMSWVKFGLLAVLAGGGAVTGLYLAEQSPTNGPQNCYIEPPFVGVPTEPVPLLQHRFPLTSLDVKDTGEAPELAVNCCGKLFLSWASKTSETERIILYTRSTDEGRTFDAPKVISKGGVYKTAAKGKMGGHERRATPHLAAMGPEVLLTWSDALPNNAGMRMLLATSTDTGTTFGEPQTVHSGEGAKPTFTSFARGLGGALACAWLDDRGGNQQPFASVRSADATAFTPELLVYPGQAGKGVCPCCPTSTAFAADGTLYVAFRNINDGYRDIAVSRLRPGQSAFEGPFNVVEKTWKFEGCPHDGPSIAVVGDTLHVVWMDARQGPQRVYHAHAKLADMKFEAKELNAAAKGTQGNPKLHADMSGNLHAVWEESIGAEPTAEGHQHGPPKVGGDGGRAVAYASIPEGKTAFGPVRVVAPKAGAFQSRPSVAGSSKGVFVAWNELDTAGKAIVFTQLPQAAEGCCK